MRKPKVVGFPVIAFGVIWIGVMGFLTFALWNTLMPAILHLPAISFWQALGLLLLSRLLFGGWGTKFQRPRWVRGWNDLTPEERKRFRQALHSNHPSTAGEEDGSNTPLL